MVYLDRDATAALQRWLRAAGLARGPVFRAGLPGVHPHTLRHSCGFALADKRHDLRLIQDYLGHREPQVASALVV